MMLRGERPCANHKRRVIKSVERWAEQAQYDLDTARAMLDAGRHLYLLFCCQQVVEKAPKAALVNRTNDLPPRIHSLIRLAEAAQTALSQERAQFFRELSSYYIQTRYPEEIPSLMTQIPASQIRAVFEQTKEVVQWLSSMT